MLGEPDLPHPVVVSGRKGDGIAVKGLSDPVVLPVQQHPSAIAYLTHERARVIDHGGVNP